MREKCCSSTMERKWLGMENIEQRISTIRNDREHGSRWLVRQSILLLQDIALGHMGSQDEQMRLLYTSAQQLAQARPAMAAISSAVGQIMGVQGGPAAIAQAAARLLEEYDTATERIASYAKPYLFGQLMTCSLSGTVLEVLVACREFIQHLVVLEGRPRYEGREMARILSQRAFAVTLITDAQAAVFLPLCDGIVVGADSILATGGILNKAGTALLAWAAHGYNKPFYVLSETLKISAQGWSDKDAALANLALLEEKEGEEVLEQAIPGVTARNFYFDHTPYKLISKVITECGMLERREIRKIAARARENQRLLARGYVS